MEEKIKELIHTPDYQQIKQDFLNELILASEGKSSSLSFIKHHLSKKPLIKTGIIQSIVIGGTNYSFATAEVTVDSKLKMLKHETGKLPMLDTKETFVRFLSAHLDPRADAIGINFGFKLKLTSAPKEQLDGLVQAQGTKEHTFTGLTEPIGQLVATLFEKRYAKIIPVVVANDTVCLLLSGNGDEDGSLIAGTGFNIGLRLKKEQQTLVNLEAGNFNKFEISPTLKKIDAKTKNPGKKLFEKTISGKYLVSCFNEKIKELNLPRTFLSTSQELSEVAQTQSGIEGNLARAILERSAFFTASALAGIYAFYNKPQTFTFIGEGSLLWNGWQYRENIQKQLTLLGVPQHTITINAITESSSKGAAGLLITPHR